MCAKEMIIISHVRDDGKIQSNEEHQQGVALLASSFATEFGCGDIAYIMGLLHDKGKEQTDWQKYIRGIIGYDKTFANIKQRPNHSYVGACLAQKQYSKIAPFIAPPIAGHHRGLYDNCDYVTETKRDIPEDVSVDEMISYDFPKFSQMEIYDFHHFVRMLFSCLVDADSLDTEAFINPELSQARGSNATMKTLLDNLEQYLRKLREHSTNSEVNRIRNYVQEQCVDRSTGDAGYYSLTVPTGGGKTLASVLWALHHAVKNNLHRIIIAIPYTSIIVQTAATLKRIFGEENVLEHHSNVNPDDIKDPKLRERLQLATENWDYPIVVTTNVQLFESLFSNKRSDCRKLHNIVNSVVILDEVQTLPLGFYKPIVHSISTLRRVFGCSFLFTTASQPVLKGRIECSDKRESFDALPDIHEIIPSTANLHNKLRRVKLEFLEEVQNYDELAKSVAQHKRVLCIVNTRKDAKEIFEQLPKEGITLHLSRMMCPVHISVSIQKIKETLKKDNDIPLRVVATQLIEAGVDIDFPVVFRQEAGLDSILQAAGRCNREGKRELSTTYVFSLGKEHPLPAGFITQTNNARTALGTGHDWFAPETMTAYFQQLHARVASFDKAQIHQLLYKPDCEFEEAAKQFRLIDDQTISVIINWQDSMKLYQRLLENGPSYPLIKSLSKYSVNIRKNDFTLLKNAGAIVESFEGIFAITNSKFYNEDTGLTIENKWLEETYII